MVLSRVSIKLCLNRPFLDKLRQFPFGAFPSIALQGLDYLFPAHFFKQVAHPISRYFSLKASEFFPSNILSRSTDQLAPDGQKFFSYVPSSFYAMSRRRWHIKD